MFMQRYLWKAAAIVLLCSTAQLAAEKSVRASNEPDEPLKAVSVHKMPPGSTPPVPVLRPGPVYPFDMRRAGLQGEVIIEFVVDTAGNVREAHVARSNNHFFERPALDAVMKWRFKPGMIEGRAVNTLMAVPIIFQLEGGGDNQLTIVSNKKSREKLPPEFQWDEAPVPVGTAFPAYPFSQLLSGQEAKVQSIIMINEKGFVQEVKFLEEKPAPKEFEQAVRAAFGLWKFKPATKGKNPCRALLKVEYEFLPRGSDSVPLGGGALDILKELKKKEPRIVAYQNLDRHPRPISRKPPAYPLNLRAEGAEGQAEIEFYIDKSGDAQLPRILSSTREEFGYAAAQAVATWRFSVPTKDGKPTITRTRIPIVFSLDADKKPAQETPAAKDAGR